MDACYLASRKRTLRLDDTDHLISNSSLRNISNEVGLEICGTHAQDVTEQTITTRSMNHTIESALCDINTECDMYDLGSPGNDGRTYVEYEGADVNHCDSDTSISLDGRTYIGCGDASVVHHCDMGDNITEGHNTVGKLQLVSSSSESETSSQFSEFSSIAGVSTSSRVETAEDHW